MARYIYVPISNKFTLGLTECEDYLLLDAYLYIIEKQQLRSQSVIRTLEYYYIQNGGTVNTGDLVKFNALLRISGRKPLIFISGFTNPYVMIRGHEKAMERNVIIERLKSLSSEDRKTLIAGKHLEAKSLTKSSVDIPDMSEETTELSVIEISRRRAALVQAQKHFTDEKTELNPLEISRRREALAQAQKHFTDETQTMTLPTEIDSIEQPDYETEPVERSDYETEILQKIDDLKRELLEFKTIFCSIFKTPGLTKTKGGGKKTAKKTSEVS